MTTFTLKKDKLLHLMATILLAMTSLTMNAQIVRNYGAPVFSDNLRGGHTMFGNTILQGGNTVMNYFQNGTASNDYKTSIYYNDESNMQHVDVDGNYTLPSASLISWGDSWRYASFTSTPDASWKTSTSNTGWSSNSSTPIRFAMGSNGTQIPSGSRNRTTYYFKRNVSINSADLSRYSGYTINVRFDDGIIVYVNGTEVGRSSMPGGLVGYSTNATDCYNGSSYRQATFTVPANLLQENNIISAEVHQASGCSSTDMYFNMEMEGTRIPNTFNSSSADLVFPAVAGAFNIKFARLYWGGRVNNSTSDATLRTVRIRKGDGNYQTITDGQLDKVGITGTNHQAYQGYRDITSFIRSNGAGTYTVADISVNTGTIAGGGYYGGWAIVVVYENPNLNYSSVRLYDGFIQVQGGATHTISLTGLSAPGASTVPSDIYMSTMAWEGDGAIGSSETRPNGDYIKINDKYVSGGVNPAQNFWNGTISKNGAHVTTKNPHYLNQMGIDIDEVELGGVDGTGNNIYGITPATTNLAVEFGTESDQYFPSVFAFTMIAKDPTVIINKTATITGGGRPNVLAPNETITYTLSGRNNGQGNAMQTVIVDTLPAMLTYVPGSLVVNSAPGVSSGDKTDASDNDHAEVLTINGKTVVKFYIGAGATPTSGGILAPGQSYSLSFKCVTPANANAGNTVTNTARVTGIGVDGEAFVDDASHIFGLGGIPLPVKLTGFKVVRENDFALLSWTTHGEINSDRFEIEKSVDGVTFTKVGTVKSNGNTNEEKSYSFRDAVHSNTSVVYYRLHMVDIDATSSYSKIVALRLNGVTTLSNFTVYPNPFTSNVKMQLNSTKASKVTVRINNAAGIQQISKVFDLQQGENIIVMPDLENLKPGVHLMEIITEEGRITQKIMKK